MSPSELYGVARSLVTYYGQPWRNARRRAFFGQFVRPGDLTFDVGAHVGDRVRTFRQLGARVVAIEPQAHLASLLTHLYGAHVTVLEVAVGERAGRVEMHVSSRTPTVTTLSAPWIDDVQRDPRFATLRWDRRVNVEVVTLEELIARYGEPTFCKIDVEGFELEVLRGLARPLRALSFEYIPVAKARAIACLERLSALGRYEVRTSPVETTRWAQPRWLSLEEGTRFLEALALQEGSGDVYARRVD